MMNNTPVKTKENKPLIDNVNSYDKDSHSMKE